MVYSYEKTTLTGRIGGERISAVYLAVSTDYRSKTDGTVPVSRYTQLRMRKCDKNAN